MCALGPVVDQFLEPHAQQLIVDGACEAPRGPAGLERFVQWKLNANEVTGRGFHKLVHPLRPRCTQRGGEGAEKLDLPVNPHHCERSRAPTHSIVVDEVEAIFSTELFGEIVLEEVSSHERGRAGDRLLLQRLLGTGPRHLHGALGDIQARRRKPVRAEQDNVIALPTALKSEA